MVKVSTLFHRVDEFDETDSSSENPELLDPENIDRFINRLLEPLVFDPGEEIVKSILKKGH